MPDHRVQALPLHLLEPIAETFNALSLDDGSVGCAVSWLLANQGPEANSGLPRRPSASEAAPETVALEMHGWSSSRRLTILASRWFRGQCTLKVNRERNRPLATPTFLSAIHDLPRWQIIEKTLFVAVLLDVALGGNGYLIHVFGLRPREIFFVLCLAWVVLRLTCIHPTGIDKNVVWLSIAFFVITTFDALLGYYNGNRVGAIIAEIKPLAYFPMLLFFVIAIRTRRDITLVAGILVACGMLLAVTYLLVLLLAAIGLFDRVQLAATLQASDEFIFRRLPFVGFFYKGDFYICVAVIFLLFDPFRRTKVLATIGIVAVAMTLTRGLALALVASIFVGIALNQNRRRAVLLVAQCALLLAVLFFAEKAEIAGQPLPASQAVSPEKTAGTAPKLVVAPVESAFSTLSPPPQAARPEKTDLAASDQQSPVPGTMQRSGDYRRLDDFKFIWERLDPAMVLFGRGLGAPIAGRDRIETTYPEMLYKQGLPGLLVWLMIALYTVYLYRNIPPETKQFGSAFLLSTIYVYVVTATNTFLTGSIGMAVVFISLASLLVLGQEKQPANVREEWYDFFWAAHLSAVRRKSFATARQLVLRCRKRSYDHDKIQTIRIPVLGGASAVIVIFWVTVFALNYFMPSCLSGPAFELKPPFRKYGAGGAAYLAPAPLLERAADTIELPFRSPYLICENFYHPLGPAHSMYADISTKGKGRFSHWTPDGFIFSTSDNSDPNTNGRRYLVTRRDGHRLGGSWSGDVTQSNPPATYRVELQLYGDVGRTAYPSTGCGGELEFLRTDGTSHWYQEHITSGGDKCTDGGLVEMRAQNDIFWNWTWTGSGISATGVVRGVGVGQQ
jgi:hypothetical protein